MTLKDWHRAGYKTVIRRGFGPGFDAGGWRVFLFRPATGVVISGPLDGGAWMDRENVNAAPWVKEPGGLAGMRGQDQANLEAVAEVCYCSSLPDGICDFCAGHRSAVAAAEERSRERVRFEGRA